MKGVIFRNDWHILTGYQIIKLFDEHFPDVAVQPNTDVVSRLKLLEVCTLEILEDRSCSSVYRIRQTDEVFQIFQLNGDLFRYTTEDYYLKKPIDKLVKEFFRKESVFKAEKLSQGKYIIEHLKSPKFKVLFDDGTYDQVEWIDKAPSDPLQIAKLMRKAGAFYSSYLKK